MMDIISGKTRPTSGTAYSGQTMDLRWPCHIKRRCSAALFVGREPGAGVRQIGRRRQPGRDGAGCEAHARRAPVRVQQLGSGEGLDAVIAFIRKQGLLDQIPRAATVSD